MNKNIQFQLFTSTQTERVQTKNQTPLCQWMTGLSVVGKSTLDNALEQGLNKKKIFSPNMNAVRQKDIKFVLEKKYES